MSEHFIEKQMACDWLPVTQRLSGR
jgi:hypothetical protein